MDTTKKVMRNVVEYAIAIIELKIVGMIFIASVCLMAIKKIMRVIVDYFIATWELKVIGLFLIGLACLIGIIFGDELDNPSGILALIGTIMLIVRI